jgi:CheY-like chemotaxis protein
VAHHFNNLLAGVLGNVYVLEDSPGRETWERESLADMRRSGESAAMLVRQLMTFARKGRASLVERDLVALIEGTIRTLEIALPSSTSIRTQLPNGMLYALVDPGAVQEIVLNLVDNARRARADRPRQLVTIRLQAVEATVEEAEHSPQGWAELWVEDEGEGIRSADLPHVCEPFFTTRDVGQGTGMGLATVYGAVGQMGGDLRIESEFGVGTQVRVRIPLMESTSAHTPANASVLPGKGETVLVVDDDDTVRSVLARVLKHLGYEARIYATAAQAIQAFDEDPGSFAALLSDMVMPEMGGCELATELRKRRPDLPVMLMTGYDPDRLDGVAQIPGETPRVLEKPIRLNQLSRAVAKLLHGKLGS